MPQDIQHKSRLAPLPKHILVVPVFPSPAAILRFAINPWVSYPIGYSYSSITRILLGHVDSPSPHHCTVPLYPARHTFLPFLNKYHPRRSPRITDSDDEDRSFWRRDLGVLKSRRAPAAWSRQHIRFPPCMMRLFPKKAMLAQNDGIAGDGTEKGTQEHRIERATEAGQQAHIHIDPELERRVRRKLDWHIIPLVSALYLLAFLDRSNIGYVFNILPMRIIHH